MFQEHNPLLVTFRLLPESKRQETSRSLFPAKAPLSRRCRSKITLRSKASSQNTQSIICLEEKDVHCSGQGTKLILCLSQESSSKRSGIKTLLRPTARDLLTSLQKAVEAEGIFKGNISRRRMHQRATEQTRRKTSERLQLMIRFRGNRRRK